MRKKQRHSHYKLIRDLTIICVSVIVAIVIAKIGVLQNLSSTNTEINYILSFISGVFFTSLFTIAPASVSLAKISTTISPYQVALFGAAGAMVGDFILFLFIRDSLAEDITEFIKHSHYKKVLSLFKFRIFRWLTPLLGALVIISPLPDELGLAMMGFSRVSTLVMLPISFCLNYLGVLLICFIAGTF